MGEVVQLAKADAERGDGRERYDDDGNWDVRMMLATDGGYEVTLVRTASPVAMAWWWDVRTSAGYDIIERSGRAFPTRRAAKDAAWKALRRLIADAKK
jgi:hypothetical protein